MKKLFLFIMIAALVTVMCGCQAFTIDSNPTSDEGWAEILMPGNTLVVGQYDKIERVSSGWMKVHINGKWYGTNEWRVVLTKEG